MKKITVFILSAIFSFSAFAHKARNQAESLNMEGFTQKWMKCESAEEDEFKKRLEDFYAEVQKSSPSDTVIYYFPEAKIIYENILSGINEGDRQKIAENVRGWEILQKNIAKLQLEQLYYSYRILIFVIIIAVLASLVFSVMYLLSSKLRKENLAFTARMIKTQEAERERISNELHDTVCQDLGVLQLRLEDEESASLCRKIASDVRGVCYALTPSDLSEGILEALISLCHVLQKQSGMEMVLSIQDELKNNKAFKTFTKDKNLNIYRIAQEIITNAIKHSGAESISVLVRTVDEKSFKIIVSDDGKGFDLKSALKKKNHFGLKNIQARAEGFGGGVSFNTETGAGTQVTVAVPY